MPFHPQLAPTSCQCASALAYLRSTGPTSIAAVARHLGTSWNLADRALWELRDKGLVKRLGRTRFGVVGLCGRPGGGE